MTTPTRRFSCKHVATRAFKDRAIGAPLVVQVHVYAHSDNAFNAIAETHDPDQFPGSPLAARVLWTWPAGTATLETVLAELPAVVAEQLCDLGTLCSADAEVLPPTRPDLAERPELAALVQNSPFWGLLWDELTYGRANLPTVPADRWGMHNALDFVESMGVEPRAPAVALAAVLCHGALTCQDGAEEKFHLLCQDPEAFDRQLPSGFRTYLDLAIESVRSRSTLAPLNFERRDLLATLRDIGQLAQPQAAAMAA